MSPEERQLLIQTHRLAEESNALLRKMHRAAIWSTIFRVLYWAVIIGLSVGAYYLVQPYVDQLQKVYSGFEADVSAAKDIGSQFGDFSKFFGKGTE